VAAARVINWTEPEYPQTLLADYDPPVMLYVLWQFSENLLNRQSLSIRWHRRS